jgi:ATP-dependent exoDNAse (exonuclease V) beta subunit
MAELLHFPTPEPLSSPLPPDHEARRRALDIHTSAIVEAPAGSGKTGLLLQRFLKLLAEGHVDQPEEVLAITFTRKATAELRERVLAQLRNASTFTPLSPEASKFDRETRALAQAVLAVDARLHWHLLDQPQRLRIRTIDSLCGEIARTLPLLSNSSASQPIEDAGPLYREAARRTLMQLGGADAALNAALRTVLLQRDGSLDDCENLLARMLAQREQWADLVPLDSTELTEAYLEQQVRPRLERSLEAIICTGLNRALEAMPPGVLKQLTALAARLGLEPGHNGDESPISLCADRHRPPAARAEDLEHWAALIHLVLKTSDGQWRARHQSRDVGFNIPKSDAALLTQLVDDIQNEPLRETLRAVHNLPSPRFPDAQWHVAKALFRLLRHSLAQLKVLFSEKGQCDFTELSLAARDALSADGGPADLASSPAARLTHLLVDEMQDTSSAQYTLLELLTRSWDGHSQTLFLVGDPKQSIYLFRQARVERFLRTVRERRLGDIPLEVLQLTANFRSQGALVESFNETFTQLFPAPNFISNSDVLEIPEVPFVHADANRKPTFSPAINWDAVVLNDGLPPEDTRSIGDLRAARQRVEARTIRRIIEAWQLRPLPAGRARPWRIAVLARTRKHLTAIAAELAHSNDQHRPIPYRAIDIDSLAERPEVLDALALTRALLHPADRTAWLAVLHAPWCGLSLADLLTLTGEGPLADTKATIPELIPARRDLLSPEGQQLIARTWPTLEAALDTLGRTSLAIHIERTWLSLGGDAPLTPEQHTNVRRFLQVLHQLELDASRIDLSLLAARLDALYAEPSADAAVELLTIHKSKGLEFDVVLVPGLDRPSNRSASDLLNWLELDSAGDAASHILLAPIWSRGDDADPLNKWLTRVKLAREHAEIKRLAYVVSTRAQEELHLFAATQRKKNGDLYQPIAGTLLHALWPAAQQHFPASAAQLASQPISHPSPDLAAALRHSLAEDSQRAHEDVFEEEGLALAASGDSQQSEPEKSNQPKPPLLRRFPLSFDPVARFTAAEATRLPYTPASALPHAATFDRPEGSFGVRAFGNVVHRFLQVLSTRLERSNDPEALLAELPAWEPRLLASLRGEGLAPTHAQHEAARALTALRNTLADPIGRWILSPHAGAASERSLATATSVLRSDRTFLAGDSPLTPGANCIWIIDFKTTEQGSRSSELFAQEERLKYNAQLLHYAAVRRALPEGDLPIHLGLFYPLIPLLLYWPAAVVAI